jgi:hypothetical protein
MKNPDPLYMIREPEAVAASNVVHLNAVLASPRERSWRDLVRRLQKRPAPHVEESGSSLRPRLIP